MDGQYISRERYLYDNIFFLTKRQSILYSSLDEYSFTGSLPVSVVNRAYFENFNEKINLWERQFNTRRFHHGNFKQEVTNFEIAKITFSPSLDAVRYFMFTKSIFLRINGYLLCGLSAILGSDSQFRSCDSPSIWVAWQNKTLQLCDKEQTSSITGKSVDIWSHYYFYFGYWG